MNNGEGEGKERKIYSDREKLLLMSLVDKFKAIIENKKTDATNLPKKNAAWKQITDLYNANDVTRRTDKQLKKLWDNLKQRTRKTDSEFKKQLIQTGGGPPPEEDNNPMTEMVRQIVPTIDYTLENSWDSTSVIIKRNSTGKTSDECKILYNDDIICEESPCQSNQQMEEKKDVLFESISSSPRKGHKILTPIGPKRKRTNSSSPYQRASLIEQEAALRIEKVQKSIEQQDELHLIRKKAAEAERNYWEKKTELLILNSKI